MPHLRIESIGNGPTAAGAPSRGGAPAGSGANGSGANGGGAGRRDPASDSVRIVPLSGPDAASVITIGRYPDCEVTLDVPTVSRRHARITRGDAADGGGFFLEDLGSRNATLLRGEPVQGRVRLRDRDEISICDVTLRFVATTPPPHRFDEDPEDGVLDSSPGSRQRPPADPAAPGKQPSPPGEDGRPAAGRPGEEDPGMATAGPHPAARGDADDRADHAVVHAPAGPSKPSPGGGAGAQSPDSDSHYDYKFTDEAAGVLASLPAMQIGGYRLDVNPEAKLRAVLSVTRDLAGSEGLDHVLDRTLQALFKAFPQADRGFVLLADGAGAEPTVRATRSRPTLTFGGQEDGAGEVRISRTIVRRVMETGEAILSMDVGGDSRFDASSSLMDLQLRSVVCVPLHGRGDAAFGVLQLDTADPARQFSEDDLDLLRAVAAPVGLAAQNARLTAEAAQRREAERDLDLAARIQQGFLPQSPPPLDGYEFAHQYEAAQSVGGDYFDYIPLPDGRVAVALGDVAGKGVPAALLMARMSAAARSHLLAAANKRNDALLPSALKRLNAELTAGPMGHRFITCVMLLIDPKSHTLYAVNAGHMAPLIRTLSGAVEPLGEVSGGMPLGIDGGQKFETASRTLRPGEAALVFTDGITEAVREGAEEHVDSGKELDARAKGLYGRERLAAVFGRTAGPASAVIDAVAADVAAWTGRGPQTDDICTVAVRRAAAHEKEAAAS